MAVPVFSASLENPLCILEFLNAGVMPGCQGPGAAPQGHRAPRAECDEGGHRRVAYAAVGLGLMSLLEYMYM